MTALQESTTEIEQASGATQRKPSGSLTSARTGENRAPAFTAGAIQAAPASRNLALADFADLSHHGSSSHFLDQ